MSSRYYKDSLNKFKSDLTNLISIKAASYISLLSLLSLAAYLFNLSLTNEAVGSQNYSAVISSQAVTGLTSSFFIYTYAQKNLRNYANKQTKDKHYLDLLLICISIVLLISTQQIGIVIASGLIGCISSMCVNKGIEKLQLTTYIISSLATSLQLIIGSIIPNFIPLRLSFIVLLLIYLYNYRYLGISITTSYSNGFPSIRTIRRALFLVIISILTIYSPMLFLGSGRISQIINFHIRSSFIITTLINSKIAYKGRVIDSNKKFNVNQLIFAFVAFLFVHITIAIMSNYLNLHGSNSLITINYNFYLALICLISSFIHLFCSRKMYSYNHNRVYTNKLILPKSSKIEYFITLIYIPTLILLIYINSPLSIPIFWVLSYSYLSTLSKD